MTSGVAERLERMNAAWAQASIPEGGFEMPPDGDYQAAIERFDWFEASNTSGHLFLKTEMRITSGSHAGAEASTVHDVEDPDRLGWLKKHLQTLGIDSVEPFATLEERLQEVVGIVVEIKIKTSSKTDANGTPYRNVYVNKRLGTAHASVGAPLDVPSAASKSDDDIPF